MSSLNKRSPLAAFEAGGKPPRYHSDPVSLTSLPEEIIFNCLFRVPRCYYKNLCHVSKTLRSLVCSPELHRLRSLLPKPKDSIYVYFDLHKPRLYRWFTLRKIEKKIEYRLVSNPVQFPTNHLVRGCSTVAVGSEILFIGGSYERPSSKLWILDTRSGEFTQGPSMNVARTSDAVVGKIDGKVYVIGGCHDDIQVEVFHPKSREWKVAESPKKKLQLRRWKRLSASGNGKIYMEEGGRILVYDPRKGGRLEEVASCSDGIWSMLVVDDMLYAYNNGQGLMGFDAKRKEWRRVLGLNTLEVTFYNAVMAEYNGMLAMLSFRCIGDESRCACALITLDWIGDVIRGTIEWHGTVATMRGHHTFHKILVCSD